MSVTELDFRQMGQLPNSDLQEFRGIQEVFAQQFGAELSTHLRKEFSITLQDIRQMTWGQYCDQSSTAACLLVSSLPSQRGHAVLELGLSFVFSVLEILLGGKAGPAFEASRELTAIERRLLNRFFESALQHLREAWTTDEPAFVLDSVISHPAAGITVARQDTFILAEFLVTGAGHAGHIRLVVPARFVRSRRQETGTEDTARPVLRQAGAEGRILNRIGSGKVLVEVALRQATIKIGDLAALKPGDVLDLAHPVTSPCSMLVNAVEAYSGGVVPVGRRRAFAIHGTGKLAQRAIP